MLPTNIVADTDFYKFGHWRQMNPVVNSGTSYLENRVGGEFSHTVFMGLTPILLDHLHESRVTHEKINEAVELCKAATGGRNHVDVDMWRYIVNHHGGRLPLLIKAMPEGSVVEEGTALLTVSNTDLKCGGLRQYIEPLLMHVWKPSTIATKALWLQQQLLDLYKKYEPSLPFSPFVVHDFSLRGQDSYQSAYRNSLAWLLVFPGSDTMPAMRAARHYYNAEITNTLKSVWATEHSVALSFGPGFDNEKAYLKHQLLHADPEEIVSIVIDTYDADNFLRTIVGDPEIKLMIINRPGRVVFRHDSGDPVLNTIRGLGILSEIFGVFLTNDGKEVLKHNVGWLWGDGLDHDGILNMAARITRNGFSLSNVVFGSGSGMTVKNIYRDTQRFAIKPCVYNGNPVAKLVASDPTKSSKPGPLKTIGMYSPSEKTTIYRTVQAKENDRYQDVMEVVFQAGTAYPSTWNDVTNKLLEDGNKRIVRKGSGTA